VEVQASVQFTLECPPPMQKLGMSMATLDLSHQDDAAQQDDAILQGPAARRRTSPVQRLEKEDVCRFDLESASQAEELPQAKEVCLLVQEQISLSRWACITAFQLVYSAINTGMGLFLLPTEAQRLNGGQSSLWVGVYIAVCGVTQLVCPIAGKLSDRHSSRWGRRRPFVVAGSALALLGFAGMWSASAWIWPGLFLASLLLGELGLNVAFSAQCGLPADLRGAGDAEGEEGDQTGSVSGIVAIHSFLGSLLAMGVLVLTRHLPQHVQYPLFMLGVAATCAVVCSSAQEVPLQAGAGAGPLTLAELRRGFQLDLKQDCDFFWVCVGRMCYYVTTSVVVFNFYYLRDMLHISGEADRRLRLGIMVVLAQVVGCVCSFPLARLSGRIGRKRVIYGACATMAGTFAVYIVAPTVGEHGSWPLVLAGALCYGVGSGAYLSVDYALALDCLPKGKTAAEAFGLWGVAGFAGSAVGPLVGGFLLSAGRVHSGLEGEAYSFMGYALVMFFLGCVMNGASALSTGKIVGVK